MVAIKSMDCDHAVELVSLSYGEKIGRNTNSVNHVGVGESVAVAPLTSAVLDS